MNLCCDLQKLTFMLLLLRQHTAQLLLLPIQPVPFFIVLDIKGWVQARRHKIWRQRPPNRLLLLICRANQLIPDKVFRHVGIWFLDELLQSNHTLHPFQTLIVLQMWFKGWLRKLFRDFGEVNYILILIITIRRFFLFRLLQRLDKHLRCIYNSSFVIIFVHWWLGVIVVAAARGLRIFWHSIIVAISTLIIFDFIFLLVVNLFRIILLWSL